MLLSTINGFHVVSHSNTSVHIQSRLSVRFLLYISMLGSISAPSLSTPWFLIQIYLHPLGTAVRSLLWLWNICRAIPESQSTGQGTAPCVHNMQIHSPLSHPFLLGGFTVSCLPLSASLCCVVFLRFRAWQAEKCNPGSSSRLWSLGRAAYTDANRLEVLIIWGTLSSSKANKPLFFSLSLSSYCATLPCKNKARISLQKYLPCFIKIQQGPSLFLNIPSFYTIPKHSSPGQRWEVTWGEVTRGTKCHGDDDPVQAGQSLGFGISSPHPSLPCLTPLCSTEYLEIRLLSQGWEQHPGLDRYFGSIVLKVLTKGFCTRHSRQMQNPIWNKRDEKDFHSPSRI